MIKFDEDIHCRMCAGQAENPRTEVPCPYCDGTGYQEIQTGAGPRSNEHVILPGVLPAPPGKPYMAPVRTACGKRLSGLMHVNWWLPGATLRFLECPGCRRYVEDILSK
jgi:hypothetical protein